MDLTTKWPFYDRFVGPIDYDKWSVIKERLRAVEVNDMTDPIRVAEVCLVPNIMVVKEFRVLDFIKYIWLEHSSLVILQHKMAKVIHVDKMLIYFFQDNLTRFVLSWYMRLNSTKINKWKDLVYAFLKQYIFNLETTYDKTSLMAMEKGDQESARVYT